MELKPMIDTLRITGGALSSMALALLGMLAASLAPMDAEAVASFSRQTQMTCNQCHTSHGGATPNFTFSGKKFNAMGYRLRSLPRQISKGQPEDQGEFLSMLPSMISGRLQWEAFSDVKPPAGPRAGEWLGVETNPTSRFSLFPFTGPIGDHFGVWTEIYIIPSTSAQGEWTIANASYEEHDFRFILNPGSKDNIYGLAFTNQGMGEIFGFGPWPAVGAMSTMDRGGIGGFQHPNRATLAAYGWMSDRWVWALAGFTGDTNLGWDQGNVKALLGYAWFNSNANELWTNLYYRGGGDALPVITDTTVPVDKHDFFFSSDVGGIDDLRPDPCPSNPRFIASGCPYLAEDTDDHTTYEGEVRWSQNNFASPFSWEVVARATFNSEEYIDGAETQKDAWSINAQVGWEHTYYVKPYVNGHFNFDFTDFLGTEHEIDTSPGWGVYLGYKPAENFLLTFGYHELQSFAVGRAAQDNGARWDITADISF